MGTMGVGKTTATRVLAEWLGFQAFYEDPSGNPYIEHFYREPRKYAFLSQSHYRDKKIAQMREVTGVLPYKPVAQDTYIAEDVHGYARAQLLLGNMTQGEWDRYLEVYDQAKPLLPTPDLVVFLQASVPVIMERIHGRGREYEAGVDQSYIELLDRLNHEWIDQNTVVPVLLMPTEQINIAKSPTDREYFVRTVKTALPKAGVVYTHDV